MTEDKAVDTEVGAEVDTEVDTEVATEVGTEVATQVGTEVATGEDTRPPVWLRPVVFGVLPVLAVVFGGAASYLQWELSSYRDAETASKESVAAARDAAVAILSYRADSVEQDLTAARDRLTGEFLGAYNQLVTTVVIPGAKEKKISAAATVEAAASVSAERSRAVALLFINQTITMGRDAPTTTASSVRVTLEKLDDRWLVSGFDPV